jgi:very-short-patch-repair endonuclease
MKNPLFATRALRINMTEAEKIFWDFVRDKNFLNKKFLHQHPISFIIDNCNRFLL